MSKAIQLYNELHDMDYLDYIENFESDILFIKSFIDVYGYQDAKKILQAYFE